MLHSRTLLSALALTLAACGGPKSATPPTTGLPATTTAPAPTPPAPTTVAAPTTTTTEPPKLEDIIAAATIRSRSVDRSDCLADPANCDPSKIAPVSGTYYAVLAKRVQEWTAAGWRSRTNLADPSYLHIKSVKVSEDKLSAEVFACEWNTGIVFQPLANVAAGEAILDETKGSIEMRLKVVPDSGTWRITEVEYNAEHDGVNVCPAKQ